MLDVALKLLKELTSRNYKAYIVGGFVRDHLLNIESNDIDITTNATPKEIKEIFEDSCLPNEDYGSVTVLLKGIRFEITTFRREIAYVNNRKPVEIKYIDDLEEDLLRRDFMINTLCMDENGEVLDLLGAREDLDKKIIRTVGDSHQKFTEDCLRILRAIRFATMLDFDLEEDVIIAIRNTKYLLKTLSYNRKKEELDKIFTSPHYKKGVKILLDLGLEEELEIPNLSQVLHCDTLSLIGIWSMLGASDKYPFSKNEHDLMKNVHIVMNSNLLDPMVLYHYGLYVSSVAGEISGIDNKKITEAYNNLAIKGRNDIQIDASSIMNLLKREPGKYLTEIFDDIEKEILYHRLNNEKEEISRYILNKYS